MDYNIIWVGNDHKSPIIAFFYCIAFGSFQGAQKRDEIFTKLKFILYKMSSDYLRVWEQKLFV